MENHQQFSLKWNNYLQHISGAFDSLRTNEDFVDVTLSCEGKKIKAHKMLLSACSNYFREIFKENQCTHPVIVFHNIKFEDLSGLVTFMYQGQVNVEQECLQSFLNTAELLEVQGLTSPSTKAVKTEDEDESVSDVSSGGGKVGSPSSKRKRSKRTEGTESPAEMTEEPPHNDDTPQDEEGEDSLPQTPQFLLHQDNSLTQDNSDPYTDSQYYQPGKEEPPDTNTSLDPSGSSNDYQDSLQGYNRSITLGEGEDTSVICYLCSARFGSNQQIANHFRLAHSHSINMFKDVTSSGDGSIGDFVCSVCSAKFKYSRNLKEHEKVHKGATTCTACGKALSSPANLRRHLIMLHVKSTFCLICSKNFGATIVEHMCSQHIPE